MSKQKQRVAIYAHVSTTEGKQTPENQLRQLRTYAKARDFTVIAEYIDTITPQGEMVFTIMGLQALLVDNVTCAIIYQ